MAVEAAAVEAAGAERAREAFAIQYDLVGLPESAKARELREKRAAGRPPGARNRRSEDVARHVIEVLGDPLLAQAAVATMPVDELAEALGCSKLEAFQEKRLAATLVLPFLHRKQPVAIDVTGRQVVYLTIHDGLPPAAHTDTARIVEVVEYQELTEGATDAV